MSKFVVVSLHLLCISVILSAQSNDESKAVIDSVESKQVQLSNKAQDLQKRLDSLQALTRKVLPDTIVGKIEKEGTGYQQPDILSKKLFQVKKGDIVVVIGFDTEWFKIIHKKGIGFILDDCMHHDDKIFNYKLIQSERENIAKKESSDTIKKVEELRE